MTLFSFANQLRFRPRTDHLRHWGDSDLFFEITFAAMRSEDNSSNFVIITSQTKSKWATKICGLLKWATTRKRLRTTGLEHL